MCTAIHLPGDEPLFGRNLDLNFHYEEQVVITPRQFPLSFRNGSKWQRHYAFIGMATVRDGYPLYYDGCNEWGLAIAGLNFPMHAAYAQTFGNKNEIAAFELIPWLLGSFRTVNQAREALRHISLVDIPFSLELPPTPLHFLTADKNDSMVIEPVADGIAVYDDPVGVLTNEPEFPWHLQNLSNYMGISAKQAENRFSPGLDLQAYSNGMGGLGLPGDYSSASRFVKAAFLKWNSSKTDVEQFFHILDAVAMPRGSVKMPDGSLEITQYSSCMDLNLGTYYYTTYDNRRIHAVSLCREDLDGDSLIPYCLLKRQDILMQNEMEERL